MATNINRNTYNVKSMPQEGTRDISATKTKPEQHCVVSRNTHTCSQV